MTISKHYSSAHPAKEHGTPTAFSNARRGFIQKGLWVMLVSVVSVLAYAGSTLAQATVTTDQSDYPPGATAGISGSGFQPGESVKLQVLRIDIPENSGPEHDPWQVTADGNGNFQTTWFVALDEAGATLQLTATGLASGLTALTTFTDAADLTVGGTVQLAGGTGIQGATITGYTDAGLTTVDNSQGLGSGTTTSAANGTWTLHLAKNATRYVVVTAPSGYHSTDAVAGTGASATRVSATELSFSTGAAGGSSSGNQFILAANATRLVITGSGSQTAGASQDLTITAKDAYGNTDTSYTGIKDLTFSGASPSPDGTNPTVVATSGTAKDFGANITRITFSSGVATVSGGENGVMTLYAAETAYISAADSANSISASTGADRLTVTVSAAAASKLVMKTEPSSSVTAGANFGNQPAVYVEDQYGNVLTGDNTTVVTATVQTGTGPLTGTLTATAVNGVATFSGLAAPTTAQTGLLLTFTASGLASAVDTTSITVTAAKPTTDSTNITFDNPGTGQIDVSWTPGNGANRIVLVKEGPDDTPVSWTPVDGTDYTANSVFSSATIISDYTRCVYNGSGSSFTLSGLLSGRTYYFKIFEYNGTGATANYYTTGSPATAVLAFAPTLASITSFGAVNEDGRAVIEWETGSEIGTIGFSLLRQDEGGRKFKRVGKEFLPGLMCSPQGGTYQLADPEAQPGQSYTYKLVEIEARGRRNTYGPFEVTIPVAAAPATKRAAKPVTTDEAVDGDYRRRAHERERVLFEDKSRGKKSAPGAATPRATAGEGPVRGQVARQEVGARRSDAESNSGREPPAEDEHRGCGHLLPGQRPARHRPGAST